jgi:hypothetical protein
VPLPPHATRLPHRPRRFASESTEFYDAALAYRSLFAASPPAEPAAVTAAAKAIVDEFVVDGSPKQINIPSAMAKAIVDGTRAASGGADGADGARPLDVTLLDAAVDEILSLMRRDTLPRFLPTPPFEEALAQAGVEPPYESGAEPTGLRAAAAAYAARMESVPSAIAADVASTAHVDVRAAPPASEAASEAEAAKDYEANYAGGAAAPA